MIMFSRKNTEIPAISLWPTEVAHSGRAVQVLGGSVRELRSRVGGKRDGRLSLRAVFTRFTAAAAHARL